MQVTQWIIWCAWFGFAHYFPFPKPELWYMLYIHDQCQLQEENWSLWSWKSLEPRPQVLLNTKSISRRARSGVNLDYKREQSTAIRSIKLFVFTMKLNTEHVKVSLVWLPDSVSLGLWPTADSEPTSRTVTQAAFLYWSLFTDIPL